MARSAFAGFPGEALAFFRGLERNNRREWFQPRKPLFDQRVKAPMLELVGALNGEMAKFAPLHVTEPEAALYRIYRDTRFSKDKKPYKTHLGAYFARRGADRHMSAGYYFHISHKEVAIGGGMYMPPPEFLFAVRGRVAERPAEFRKLLQSKLLRKLLGDLHGEQLSRVPKGFCAEHPAADLLRYKQFFFYVELPPELAQTGTLQNEIRKRFEVMTPLIEFLNAPLAETRPKPGRAIF
jgi:uncharacterized protein (TIGR02453 family)